MIRGIHEIFAKRAINYLLNRFFGNYLQTFTHDELSLSSSKGTGVIQKVSFKVEAINDLLKENNLPLELISGSIETIKVEVPWSSIFTENSIIEFSGIVLVIRPHKCTEDGLMLSSMWESMTSSMQLAEDCLLQKVDMDAEFDISQPAESVELMTKAINTVVSKMKVKFSDVLIRVETVMENSSVGVALEIHINSAECIDEAGAEPVSSKEESGEREPAAYCTRTIMFEGLQLFTAQFTADIYDSVASSPFTLIPGSPEMPPPHTSLPIQKTDTAEIQTEPILILKVKGSQQIRVKLKQNDSVIGPQVDIEINFGSLSFVLTPFQLHLLIELMNGLTKPGTTEKKQAGLNVPSNRPMRPEDFALIEQELQRHQQKLNTHSKSLQNCPGWSSNSLDELDDDFHGLSGGQRIPSPAHAAEDFESSYSSSVGSERASFASSPGTVEGRKLLRGRGSNLQNLLLDSSLDLTHIYVTCSSLLVIVFHEDIVCNTDNPDGMLHNSKPSKNFSFIKSRAEKYFDDLDSLGMKGLNLQDFSSMRGIISNLCPSNHLRFLASGITFDGNEKSCTLQRLYNTTVTMSNFEILECSFNAPLNENIASHPTYTKMVTFLDRDTKIHSPISTMPCFKMKYSRSDIPVQQRALRQPPNKLLIQLAPVSLEIDISLVDRIHSLLHPDLISTKKDKIIDPAFPFFSLMSGDCSNESQRTEVQLTSSFVVVNMRFPVTDLRPFHDMERVPWWKQNLHKEVAVFELSDASLSFDMEMEQYGYKFVIQCRDFHGLFQMNQNEEPVSLVRVSVDPEVEKATQDKGFDWPRLVIDVNPQKNSNLLDADMMCETVDCGPMSITDTLMSNIGNEPSPFCSNSVFCGMKSSNRTSNENQDSDCDDDKIITPADKAKLNSFIDGVVSNSQYVFHFTLPTVNIVLPDKQTFELIYNRMFIGLPLWTNVPLSVFCTHEGNGFMTGLPLLDLNPLKEQDGFHTFYTCDSNNFESESDEEDGIYYSLSEHKAKQLKQKKSAIDSNIATKISLVMDIIKGSVTIQTPLKDSVGNVVPGYCGKLQLLGEEAKLFVASHYKGDPDESYVCLQLNHGSLYHNGTVLIPIERKNVEPYTPCSFENSSRIIYCSEPGVPSNAECRVGLGRDSLDMVTVAVHAVNDAKQQLKTFKVALGFCGTTLRHYMCHSPQLFLNQFRDFVTLDMEPIDGYTPSAVVVELHMHLSHCAIDYRPIYLPLRTVLTAENFSLSTHIAASETTSLLRVISEELRLFLSIDTTANDVDLKKNYVCVIDTGLIDLSVRHTAVNEKSEPKFEMCASNNMIHVRTCADSCQALQKLIIYLATYGDFYVPGSNQKNQSSNKSANDFALKNDAAFWNNADNVQSMMVEAMKDCSSSPNSLGGKSGFSSDTDEEFCILEDSPGVGLLPKNREPQIKVLTDKPILIMENHFNIPTGKSDLLKAPKHFPEAILVHTLREMSVTWHLYGGNDFSPKTPEKKRVRINLKDTKDGLSEKKSEEQGRVEINSDKNVISFCKVTPVSKEFNMNAMFYSLEEMYERQSNGDSWVTRGGEKRDHNVLMELQMNKVRFQHEEYPEDSEYASRDALFIHDIEIRDKLTSSSINKFLYQYSSESMPRQTHANMIVVKAVHVRSDPKHFSQECSLKVSCKPLRLNIDQDALLFLIDFFREFFQESFVELSSRSPSHEVKPVVPAPDNVKTTRELVGSPTSPSSIEISSPKTYFRYFSFTPEVLIRIDYQGKRVMMDQGAVQGLIMGLTQLNCSEITLKSLSYRHGLLGIQKLATYAFNEWAQDIKKNQLPSILGGIGPMHSFVQLFQGFKDLVWLPVVQYRKDGQIVRGLQRGASSFSTSTASACIELTSRLITVIQGAAEVAYDMVSPGPSIANQPLGGAAGNRRLSQPADMREGVATAYNVMKEGFDDTFRTIARVASVEHEHKGVRGAVGGVLRQIPPATVKPIILGAEAACIMLGGVKHQLVPDAHKEAIDKWRTKRN